MDKAIVGKMGRNGGRCLVDVCTIQICGGVCGGKTGRNFSVCVAAFGIVGDKSEEMAIGGFVLGGINFVS